MNNKLFFAFLSIIISLFMVGKVKKKQEKDLFLFFGKDKENFINKENHF